MPKTAVANRSAIQVIDRLCDLMNALMMNGGQTSLKVLAAETGLHPSTAFRILSSAIDNGWVSRNDHGQYILGRQLIGLAQQSQVAIDVRLEALPLMKKLRQQLGETVNLTFREGDAVVYVERVVSTRTSHVGRIVGSRIHARAWELLVAMLVMEAAFGLAGVVAAPIYYAYLKRELEAARLI